jgi:hypothetical protein
MSLEFIPTRTIGHCLGTIKVGKCLSPTKFILILPYHMKKEASHALTRNKPKEVIALCPIEMAHGMSTANFSCSQQVYGQLRLLSARLQPTSAALNRSTANCGCSQQSYSQLQLLSTRLRPTAAALNTSPLFTFTQNGQYTMKTFRKTYKQGSEQSNPQ